ncbi:MAG: hypothetical protein ACM3H9_11275 [Rhodospirillaceae bacterium]
MAFLVFCGLVTAGARADVTQTLDSVDAVSNKRVLEMRFGDQPRPGPDVPGYESVDAAYLTQPAESFLACQRAADRDLYCLLNSYTGPDGKLTQPVRRWSASGPPEGENLFSCTDSSLGLDRRRANPCTSLTVDLAGNIWLGGRNGTTHSVLKVVAVGQGRSCSAAPLPSGDKFRKIGDLTDSGDFCFRPYASGRPVLVDMTSIDQRMGLDFQVQPGNGSGAGLLLLEDRKTAVFLADPTDPGTGEMLEPLPPVEIASGKSGWNLVGNETVQSLSLLQVDCLGTGCSDAKLNYVLATTSTGKVIAKQTDPLGTAVTLFQSPSPASCGSSAPPQYWVRVSPQSGAVYLSDRNCAVVRQLDVTASPLALTQALSPLSTSPAATSASGSLSTVSVSPGIGFNLNECYSGKCILAPNGNDTRNDVGAYITNVDIDPAGQSGLAVFRITGIPDCRYPPHRVGPLGDPGDPDYYGGNPDGVCSTLPDDGIRRIGDREYLDVAGLLPLEIRSLFNESTDPTLEELDASGLLIGPQYRARPNTDPEKDNTFEAFFGRSEDGSTGVVFRDTFELKFDIGQLTAPPGNDPVPSRCGYLNTDNSRRNATEWDAIVTVSERTPVVDLSNGTAASPSGEPGHVAMLTNTFCENPTSGAGVRWSLYAYGLMLTDTSPKTFLNLVSTLYDDLERARLLTACQNYSADGGQTRENQNQPLSPSVCSGLAADWRNGLDKLNKCIAAATDPKTSAADQNCQAFVSQVKGYRSRVAAADIYWDSPPGSGEVPDRANRRGELEARADVILHIFSDQFVPSIPLGGFPP